MKTTVKRLASLLPRGTQTAIRRHWYGLRYRLGRFASDEPEYRKLQEWISPNDWAVDIGANIGVYTARMSKLVGPGGHVFAFEPVRETFHLLAFNARLFPYSNTSLFNVATSDAFGLVGVELPTMDSGLPNIYEARISLSGSVRESFRMRIDGLSLSGKVSLVKVDTEGHELSTLQGMEQLLGQHSPTLIVEGECPKVADYLASFGYQQEQFSGSPNKVFRCGK